MSNFKKYYSWKWEINHIIKAMPKAILGAFVFAGLLRKKEKTYYLVLPLTLGDAMLALSYLAEFKRQKNIDHLTAVCTHNYVRRLCEYYPNTVDDVICRKRWQLVALRGFVDTRLGQYLSTLCLDRVTFVFLTCNISMRTLWDNPSINFPVYAKAILYKISMSSLPERPRIPAVDISKFISRYCLKKGQTVFLNPVANSVHCDVTELLVATVIDLVAKGYEVFTFTASDKEQPIQGTWAIPCTLEEAYFLAEYGGTLIGVRSGFLDVLVYAKCKVISLIDAENGLESFFRIEDLQVNPDCHTIVYDGDDTAALHAIANLVS